MPYAKPVKKVPPTLEQRRWRNANRAADLGALAREVLNKARDLLSDRSRWCTGTLAKDDHGVHVQPWDPTATHFCALGAISKAAHEVSISIDMPAGYEVLDLEAVASDLARQHISDAALKVSGDDSIVRESRMYHADTIPSINDHSALGGYRAIIIGLMAATGIAADVAEAALAYQAQVTENRREAALKAWRKRRDARRNDLAKAEAAQTPIVFGGSVTASPGTNAISITSAVRAVSEVTA